MNKIYLGHNYTYQHREDAFVKRIIVSYSGCLRFTEKKGMQMLRLLSPFPNDNTNKNNILYNIRLATEIIARTIANSAYIVVIIPWYIPMCIF